MTSFRFQTSQPGLFVEQPSPSLQVLKQRIRENIIDYLELASSAEEQREYERRAPIAQVPAEVINLWEDSVRAEDFEWYGTPVFSIKENEAIRSFHEVWDGVAEETPDPMPSAVEALIGAPQWNKLMQAAAVALAVFRERGRFSRDREEPVSLLQGAPPPIV